MMTADLYIKKQQLVNDFHHTRGSLKGHFRAVPAFPDTQGCDSSDLALSRSQTAFSHGANSCQLSVSQSLFLLTGAANGLFP